MRFIALSLVLAACGTARPVSAPSTANDTGTFRTDATPFDLEAGDATGRVFDFIVPVGTEQVWFEATAATGTLNVTGFEGDCETTATTVSCFALFPTTDFMVVSVTSGEGATGVDVAWEVAGIRDGTAPRTLFDGEMNRGDCRSITTPQGAFGSLVVESTGSLDLDDRTFACGTSEATDIARCRADQMSRMGTFQVCSGSEDAQVSVAWHPAEILADRELASGETLIFDIEAETVIHEGYIHAPRYDIDVYSGPYILDAADSYHSFQTTDDRMQLQFFPQDVASTNPIIIASYDHIPDVYAVAAPAADAIGNDPSTAYDMEDFLEGTYEVSAFLHPGDVDVFRLPEGSFTLSTTGDVDTVGRIVDGTGIEVLTNDDGGEGTNFRMDVTVAGAADLYLEVTGYNGVADGAYTLVLVEE